MNREEAGRPTPDPEGHSNDEKAAYKFSHHKPTCPKCQKKTVTSYVRGTHREYVAIAYYCSHCDMMVKQMSIEPPKVFRMDVRDFLSGTKEKFDVILADPPWHYNIEAPRERDRISNHYQQMTTRDMCDLPVQNITKKDSYIFVWATPPKLDDGMKVLQSWGFEYLTHLSWDKELMGLGHVVRQQHELLLIGRKGKPKAPEIKFRSVIREKRTDHSRKPQKSYEIIDAMFPEAKKIELFARWTYPGWTGVGDQAEPKPEGVHAKIQKKCMQKFEVEVI